MLVLTRRLHEEIVMNGNIRVTVLDIRAGRVRLGVTAPLVVRVDRAEVHEKRGDSAEASGVCAAICSSEPTSP